MFIWRQSLFLTLAVTIFVCSASGTTIHARPFNLETVQAQIEADYGTVRHIMPGDLESMLTGKAQVILFDVREAKEFGVSRIKNAIRVDPGIWPSTFLRSYGEKVMNKVVVFYCSVGVRSSRLASRVQNDLSEKGASRVVNLEGGIFNWHNEDRILQDGHGETRFVHPYDAKWGQLVQQQSLLRYKPRPIDGKK